ncbi:hypothetical protein KIW84_063346 [Lathyrus oleraceus]|uniref:TFIIS N-terminal domain-containing protein n=1 Tax=Pisum sativum TaxID=3888 RepID=A0A9D5A9I3_PEA|nr:hypothetical protein KIW84_063346 [Pisum sativum]
MSFPQKSQQPTNTAQPFPTLAAQIFSTIVLPIKKIDLDGQIILVDVISLKGRYGFPCWFMRVRGQPVLDERLKMNFRALTCNVGKLVNNSETQRKAKELVFTWKNLSRGSTEAQNSNRTRIGNAFASGTVQSASLKNFPESKNGVLQQQCHYLGISLSQASPTPAFASEFPTKEFAHGISLAAESSNSAHIAAASTSSHLEVHGSSVHGSSNS